MSVNQAGETGSFLDGHAPPLGRRVARRPSDPRAAVFCQWGQRHDFPKGFDEGDGTLLIDGQDASGSFSGLTIPQGVTFDNLIIRNNARVIVDDPILVNDGVQILSGSILTHSVGQTNGLEITAQSVLVDETSTIDVSEKGYRGGLRDGNPNHQGVTTNETLGSSFRSGGVGGQSCRPPLDRVLRYLRSWSFQPPLVRRGNARRLVD